MFEPHMEPILDPYGARCRWQLVQLGISLAPVTSITLLVSCWQHHLIHRQISKGPNQHLQFLVRWHAVGWTGTWKMNQCHCDACGYIDSQRQALFNFDLLMETVPQAAAADKTTTVNPLNVMTWTSIGGTNSHWTCDLRRAWPTCHNLSRRHIYIYNISYHIILYLYTVHNITLLNPSIRKLNADMQAGGQPSHFSVCQGQSSCGRKGRHWWRYFAGHDIDTPCVEMDLDGCIQCNCACLKMGDAQNISFDLKSQWKIYDLMMNHGIIALCSNYM